MRKQLSVTSLLLLLVISLMMASCASLGNDAGSPEVVAGPAPAAPGWPPADTAPRSASDDSIEIPGSDFTSAGGGAHAVATVCKLNDGPAPWAIYSLGNFSAGEIDLGSIDIEFNKLTGEGTVLYIGAANYSENRWEWFSTEGDDLYTFTPLVPADYYSPAGNVHLALLRTGPATIDIQKLVFNRLGDVTITPPDNLRSDEQTPENIGLLWDPVPGASGYNVYYSRYNDLSEPQKMNSEPVVDPQYDAKAPLNGIIYFFFVTAVAATESGPSDFIDIFAPLIDMPAPQNPHVSDSTPTSVTIGWEWDTETLGPEPVNGFYVYLKPEKDFNLDPVIEIKYRSQPWARSAQFTGLDQGALYYYRIVGASSANQRGRMTDDLPAITGEFWDWTGATAIAPGSEPIRGVVANGEANVVWFSFGDVVLAQGSGSSWTPGTCGLDSSLGDVNFSNYIDIDVSGGDYLVSAFNATPYLDLYAAYGSPQGGWTVDYVDDGTGGSFESPSAGNYCTAAIAGGSYHILHQDFYANMTFIHSRPVSGGSWTRTDVRAVPDENFPLELDMRASGNTVEFLYFSYEEHELFHGIGPSPYTITQITDNMGDNNGTSLDLSLTPGGWVSTSYDVTNKDLYLLRQVDTDWSMEEIAVSPGSTSGFGRNARIEAFRTDGLVCVFLDDDDNWHAAVHDGTQWFQQVMLLPINAGNSAELLVVNDEPNFIVKDLDTGNITCITGVIPPFDEL